MLRKLFDTSDSVLDTVLRLVLAAVYFPHGAQKVLGWFGGYGFSGTMGFFTQKAGIPFVIALLVFAAEFLGSIGLFVGLFARVAAFGIFCVMVGAVAMVHGKVGFFMNWGGGMPAGTEGFEYHLLALALCLSVMVRGAGAYSLDRWIRHRAEKEQDLTPASGFSRSA